MVSCTLAVQFSVKVLYGGVTKDVMICGSIVTSITGPVKEKQHNTYVSSVSIFCISIHLSVHASVTHNFVHIEVKGF